MAIDFDLPTADLIDKRFKEGEAAANKDRYKPEGEESDCPYENGLERCWWLRGYTSETRRVSMLNQMDLQKFADTPSFSCSFGDDW